MTQPEPLGFFREEAGHIFGFAGIGAAPVIFEPSLSGDVDTEMTMVHERVHQLLLRVTSFGHFTYALAALAKTGRQREFRMVIKAQEVAQEAAAYYMSVADAIRRSPGDAVRLRRTIPPKCDPIIDPLIAHFPLVGEPALLAVRAAFVEAIARCAFNSGCLDHFKNPRSLTESALESYLKKESPTMRFHRILGVLVKGQLNRKIESAGLLHFEGTSQGQADRLLSQLTRTVIRSVADQVFVATPIHIVAHHAAFAEKWRRIIGVVDGKPPVPPPGEDPPGVIEPPQDPPPAGFKTLDPRVLQQVIDLAKPNEPAIFLWIYMRNLEEAFVEVFYCGVGPDGLPHRPDTFARYAQGQDFISGAIEMDALLKCLDKTPKASLVVTFYRHCWVLFQHVTKGRKFPAFAFVGDAERELGSRVIGNFLKKPEFIGGAYWYGIQNQDSQVSAGFLISRDDPTCFAVVRLTNEPIRFLFVKLVLDAGIPAAPVDKLGRKKLLEIAALPLVVDPLRAEDQRRES